MIFNYSKFNENFVEFKQYDRVITHGNMRFWTDEGECYINLEGQTGIIDDINIKTLGRKMYGVVFDNYFSPFLGDLDKTIRIKRGLWIGGEDRLEKVKTETLNKIRMMFSKQLKMVLEYSEYIDNPIYKNINYIDITDKNDTISYLSDDRVERISDEDDQWTTPLRQEMKIGRFFQIINPYTNEVSLNKKIDLFKAAYNGLISKKYSFEIVKGEDIAKWYDHRNYQEGAGSLNKSCMRDKLDRLFLYVDNPDKINMLVMINEETNKLMGRALLWKVDKPDIIYMDRPYVIYQEDIHCFEEYAKKNSWNYYEVDKYKKMVVYVKSNYGHPENNPYMDTFIVFCIKGDDGGYYLTNKFEGVQDFYEFNEL
jgi:hypothetical protein